MTSVSKNVYVNKLDGIVNKYNNTYLSTIKMNAFDVKSYVYLNKENNKEDLKFNVGYHILEYQNIKTFSQKLRSKLVFFSLLWLKKVKNSAPWTYVISDVNSKEFVRKFSEQESQKTNQKGFRVENVIKWKVRNYILNGKPTIILLTVGLIKKNIVWMGEYFSKPRCLEQNVKVELDLSNYTQPVLIFYNIQPVLIYGNLLEGWSSKLKIRNNLN